MKRIRSYLFIIAVAYGGLLFLPSCKEKNEVFPPKVWSEYPYSGAAQPKTEITAIFFDSDHSFWLGLKDKDGLLYNDGYAWKRFDITTTGIEIDSVTAIVRDGNNKLWIGSKDGLACFDGLSWSKIAALENKSVSSIAVEGIGNLWVGLKGSTKGVAYLHNNVWTIFNKDNTGGILDSEVNAIAIDRNQLVWFATKDQGIIKRDQYHNWQFMTLYGYIDTVNFSCLATATDGSVWASNAASQLVHFQTGEFSILETGTGKPITSMLFAEDGTLWCGTLGAGLLKFDGSIWKSYTVANADLPSDNVYCLTKGFDGDLFFTTTGGRLLYLKP